MVLKEQKRLEIGLETPAAACRYNENSEQLLCSRKTVLVI